MSFRRFIRMKFWNSRCIHCIFVAKKTMFADMKKVWLILVLALLAVNSYAKEPMFVSDSVEIIPIHHGGGIKPGGGRGQISSALRLFLVDDSDGVSLVFSIKQALGLIEYSVINQTTGGILSGSFYALPGSYPLPLPGTSGYYTVEFILPDGTEYYGDFWL